VLKVDGKVVPAWPFAGDLASAPRPFILQHALKDLLLAAPVDRFNRFAALLGFEELTQVHKDLMAFCTKPPLPASARSLSADIDSLVLKADASPDLAGIAKSIRKGLPKLNETRALIKKSARALLPPHTPDTVLLSGLMSKRSEATSKVFDGAVSVSAFTPVEATTLDTEEAALLRSVKTDALTLVAKLAQQSSQFRIAREMRFYNLGVELLQEQSTTCPFCGRTLTAADAAHIRDRHASLIGEEQGAKALAQIQHSLEVLLSDLDQRISDYYRRIVDRTTALLKAQESLPQLEALLSEGGADHLAVIKAAIQVISETVSGLKTEGQGLRVVLKSAQTSLRQQVVETALIEELGVFLVRYLAVGKKLRSAIANHASGLDVAQKALSEEVNRVAGTKSLSLVIDFLENDRKIEKRL
jgi:hypothetical protein